jgi:gas vesicle protein
MTRKLLLFVLGLMFGAAVGGVIITLIAPASGKQMRKGLKSHVSNALSEGNKATLQRRRELEKQYQTLTRPQRRW